jgi:hypothetical protein
MCRQNRRITNLESEVTSLRATATAPRAVSPPPGFIGGVSFGTYAPPAPSAPATPMMVYTHSQPTPWQQPRQWAPPPKAESYDPLPVARQV